MPAVRSGNFLSFLLWGSTFPTSDSRCFSSLSMGREVGSAGYLGSSPGGLGVWTCGALDLGLNPVFSPRR